MNYSFFAFAQQKKSMKGYFVCVCCYAWKWKMKWRSTGIHVIHMFSLRSYFNCVIEKLWLTLSDLCAQELRGGVKFVFNPEVLLSG